MHVFLFLYYGAIYIQMNVMRLQIQHKGWQLPEQCQFVPFVHACYDMIAHTIFPQSSFFCECVLFICVNMKYFIFCFLVTVAPGLVYSMQALPGIQDYWFPHTFLPKRILHIRVTFSLQNHCEVRKRYYFTFIERDMRKRYF